MEIELFSNLKMKFNFQYNFMNLLAHWPREEITHINRIGGGQKRTPRLKQHPISASYARKATAIPALAQ